MPTPIVKRARVSMIWADADLRPIVGPHGPLGRGDVYSETFNEAQKRAKVAGWRKRHAKAVQAASGNGQLQTPWADPYERLFWSWYLGGVTPGSISGLTAWRELVPLRMGIQLSISDPDITGGMVGEAFVYPFFRSFVLTLNLTSDLTVPDLAKLAFETRARKRFDVDGMGRPVSVEGIAASALENLRLKVTGRAKEPLSTSDPFTVATILVAEGFDPNVSPPDDVRRTLQAITSWHPGHATERLLSLDEARVKETREGAEGDVLYGRRRSRAVWMPTFFDPKVGGSTLTCYHRNLVVGSMHVDALTSAVHTAARQAHQPSDLSLDQRECLSNAIRSLEALEVGRPSTYRSASLKRQILDSGVASDIATLETLVS